MLEAHKVKEVVSYWHNLACQFVPWWFAVNRDTWNSLSPDIQKIMEEAAARIPDRVDTEIRKQVFDAIQIAKDQFGLKVIDLEPEEIAKWQKRTSPIQEEFIGRLEKSGVDAKKIFADLDRLYKKHEKW